MCNRLRILNEIIICYAFEKKICQRNDRGTRTCILEFFFHVQPIALIRILQKPSAGWPQIGNRKSLRLVQYTHRWAGRQSPRFFLTMEIRKKNGRLAQRV
jgi:hypothetical protein